jgi:hypothetical protein
MLRDICQRLYFHSDNPRYFTFYCFNSAKAWSEEMASICVIISRHLEIPLHFSPPSFKKTLILIYYSQFMNNANRFKTGRFFYALAA